MASGPKVKFVELIVRAVNFIPSWGHYSSVECSNEMNIKLNK